MKGAGKFGETFVPKKQLGKPSLTVFVAIATKRKKNLTMLLRR